MVEWKKLSDVAVIKNGKDYKKLSNGTIPVYGTGGIMTYVDQFASDKPSVLLPRKGSVENIFYVDKPFWTVDTLYWTDIDTSRIDPKFLFMSLQRYNLKEYAYGGARPSLSQSILYNLDIPLPSLSEQQRIVEQLDTFTSSIENLKEQIVLRRKQYEYYRDQLLDLKGKEGVEMKTLGEVGDVCMCKRIMKEQTSENEEIPFFKIGTFGSQADAFISRDLFEEYKSKYSYPKKGEILISASGTIGRSVVFDGEDAYYQDSNIVWIANDEKVVTNRYLYYFYQVADWKVDGGTIKRLYNYNLKNTTIPLPPLTEQQRIVSILDTFEASIQNLEQQLAQREKQYEYYRNKLLTFE